MNTKPAASLVAFFTGTFALTWLCWLAAARLVAPGSPPTGIAGAVFLTGVFSPGIVALALAALHGGRREIIDLLRRLVQWRVALRWYVFAAGFMVAIKLTVALLCRAGTGAWPRFGSERPVVMAIAIISSVLLGGQAGEEIGWRGYALPRLADRIGFAPASLLIGILWALWHLPLFFILGGDTSGQSFPLYALQVTALSVALSWLYLRTNGSLLLTMLMHAAVNNTKDIVPSAVAGAHDPFALSTSLVGWLTVALMWACAAYFLVRMWRVRRLEVISEQ